MHCGVFFISLLSPTFSSQKRIKKLEFGFLKMGSFGSFLFPQRQQVLRFATCLAKKWGFLKGSE